jgi:hypothetical protein
MSIWPMPVDPCPADAPGLRIKVSQRWPMLMLIKRWLMHGIIYFNKIKVKLHPSPIGATVISRI